MPCVCKLCLMAFAQFTGPKVKTPTEESRAFDSFAVDVSSEMGTCRISSKTSTRSSEKVRPVNDSPELGETITGCCTGHSIRTWLTPSSILADDTGVK